MSSGKAASSFATPTRHEHIPSPFVITNISFCMLHLYSDYWYNVQCQGYVTCMGMNTWAYVAVVVFIVALHGDIYTWVWRFYRAV